MPQKKNAPRWIATLLIWTLLIIGSVSLLGCRQPLQRSEDDTRSCYIGVVTEKDLLYVQTWSRNAHVGDLLVSRTCDDKKTEDKLNDIRRLANERREVAP